MAAPDQFGLFGDDAPVIAPPGESTPPLPTRSRTRGSVSPAVAQDVLADVNVGRFGLLDDTDRIVVFDDDRRVRHATDEDTVAHLIEQGYVEQRPRRDTVTCLHGVIRRPVTPLRLTKRGRGLLDRWSALRPIR